MTSPTYFWPAWLYAATDEALYHTAAACIRLLMRRRRAS